MLLSFAAPFRRLAANPTRFIAKIFSFYPDPAYFRFVRSDQLCCVEEPAIRGLLRVFIVAGTSAGIRASDGRTRTDGLSVRLH